MISRRAMLALMGGLPFSRPDQHYEPPSAGVVPGSRSGILRAIKVIIAGTNPPASGLFLYSPSAGAGNLVASGAAGSGTDGTPGNAVIGPGWVAYFNNLGTFQAIAVTGGKIQLYSAATEAGPWTSQAAIGPGVNPPDLTMESAGNGDVRIGSPGTGNVIFISTATQTLNTNSSMLTLTNQLATPNNDILRINTAGTTTDKCIGVRAAGDTNDRFLIQVTPQIQWGSGSAAPDITLGRGGANILQLVTADFDLTTAGRGLRVAEGSNAKQGTATLAAGTVTVANTSVTANSRIFLTAQNSGAAPGALRVSARTAGTSFTITSTSATDTSLVAYEIFEPG